MSESNIEYTLINDKVTLNDVIWGKSGIIARPNPPISTICIGDSGTTWMIGVDKKFNWFQKKMIKGCFGFEVKENNNETN